MNFCEWTLACECTVACNLYYACAFFPCRGSQFNTNYCHCLYGKVLTRAFILNKTLTWENWWWWSIVYIFPFSSLIYSNWFPCIFFHGCVYIYIYIYFFFFFLIGEVSRKLSATIIPSLAQPSLALCIWMKSLLQPISGTLLLQDTKNELAISLALLCDDKKLSFAHSCFTFSFLHSVD